MHILISNRLLLFTGKQSERLVLLMAGGSSPLGKPPIYKGFSDGAVILFFMWAKESNQRVWCYRPKRVSTLDTCMELYHVT